MLSIFFLSYTAAHHSHIFMNVYLTFVKNSMHRNKIRDEHKTENVEEEETIAIANMLCHDDFLKRIADTLRILQTISQTIWLQGKWVTQK